MDQLIGLVLGEVLWLLAEAKRVVAVAASSKGMII
jgi:hypothetical protein